MKIQNINFKKVFIIFFASLSIFSVVSVLQSVATSQWEEAVSFEQNRIETNQRITRFGRREGRFGNPNRRRSYIRSEIDSEQVEADAELVPPTRSLNDRMLYGVARTYVRITSIEFSILNIFSFILRISFRILLALWVYVDSKKREQNALLWSGLTFFTHLFGWIIYMVFREVRRVVHQRNV